MTRLFRLFISISILVFINSAGAETNKPYTPKPGSPERKTILDAVRKELQITNQFEVFYLRIKNDLAYFSGGTIPNGQCRKCDRERVKALAEKQRDGSWKIVDVWTLAKEDASIQQYRAFSERVRKRLQAEGGVEDIFIEESL